MRNKRRGGPRGHRGFWHDWHEELDRRWQEEGAHDSHEWSSDFPGPPPFPPPKMARFWREYFHNFMGTWPEDHWVFGGRRFRPWHNGQEEFNPFVASMMSKGGGLLPLIVLHLLAKEPRYGNEIMDLINQKTGGQWVANPGAIYPLLAVLEEEQLVTGSWADPVKRTMRMYEITPTGEKELARLKAVVKPKMEEAITVLDNLSAELNGPSDFM